MQSNKAKKPQSSESRESSAIAEFNRALHHSTQQIELQVQTAQDAADISRQHAARAKEHSEKAGSIDVLQIVLVSVGLSAVLTAAGLTIVKHSITQELQSQQVQKHEQQTRK